MIKRHKPKQDQKYYRVNERIFAQTLRVLDTDGKQIGVMSKADALILSEGQGLDLVEIAPAASPPVAKMIDYKKFIYQEEKKKREEKRNAKVSETKEIRLGPHMSDNDLQTMIRRTRDFLEDGDKVRLVLKFRGRQIVHPEFGHEIIRKVIMAVEGLSKVDREPHFEGKQLISLLSAERKKKHAEEKNQKISEQAL